MKDNTTAKKVSKIDRLINGIEAVCNKLPPPAILFCWLFLFTAVIGAIFTMTGLTLDVYKRQKGTRPQHIRSPGSQSLWSPEVFPPHAFSGPQTAVGRW